MNIQLGSGKVHAASETPGHLPLPKCGGNKPAERYRKTGADVTCKACFKVVLAELEKIEAEDAAAVDTATTPEETPMTAKLKMQDVQADVRVGVVVGGNETVHALKDEQDDRGRNVAQCSIRPKNPIQSWGKASEQKPHLELCAACSKLVPLAADKPAPVDDMRDVEPGMIHPFLSRIMAAVPDRGTLHSARVGYTGKTRHAVWEGDDKTVCNKAAGSPTPSDHIVPDCRTCITRLNTLLMETADMATAKPAKKTAAAKPSAAEVDGLISDVHATVDQLKALDPKSEGVTTEAAELKQEAEGKIRQLPTAKRTALRKALKEAFDAKSAEIKAKDEPAPASTEVATKPAREVAVDPRTFEGVDELITEGAKRAREGVELGIKMGGVSEHVAQVILNMRTRIPNPALGDLPDLMADRKTTKNAAAEIYKLAKKGVEDDDVQRKDAYDSLIKSVQNKNSDVLVDWLHAMDNPDSWEAFAEIFPKAARMVEAARSAKDAGEEHIENHLTPQGAIRVLYADQGVTLPLKGRTQIAREQAAAKRLESAQKELSAAKEVAVDVAAAPEEREEAKAKVEKLTARITDLEASVPEDARKAIEPGPSKTHEERITERFTAAQTLLAKVAKGAETIDGAARAKLKADMNALIADLAREAAKL
ncbi:hypothetical protein ACFWIP_17915 [Streptomyces anulatus]|uniref:hypothetical protein n=1 Tax=Streptomyces anulatus TaxID=1892 RepID=UPI00365A87CD